MSEIKSYSVGNGDMFYINHGSDNFTIIDCCLNDDNQKSILDEVATLSGVKGITRFISTHPDDDHMRGLDLLDDKIKILNFYCVKNETAKEEETESFTRYCELRQSDKAFHIFKGCSRKWMNLDDEVRGSSGINVLWPDTNHHAFKDALIEASLGGSPNNLSPIIRYAVKDGVTALWMGDLETEFMEEIEDAVDLPAVDILFPPHHGRDSGKIPTSMLEKLSPKIVVIGEAPSEHLNYYAGYNTITQNSAGDILFDCVSGQVHVFTSYIYTVDFLEDYGLSRDGWFYVGTLNL